MIIESLVSAGYQLLMGLLIVSSADLICGFVHWFEDRYGKEW